MDTRTPSKVHWPRCSFILFVSLKLMHGLKTQYVPSSLHGDSEVIDKITCAASSMRRETSHRRGVRADVNEIE
eukprot:1529988-Amphidinium_carterae.1